MPVLTYHKCGHLSYRLLLKIFYVTFLYLTMDDDKLCLPRMTNDVDLLVRRYSSIRRMMEHILDIAKASTILSDMSTENRCLLLHCFHTVTRAVDSTIYSGYGNNRLTQMMETHVGDCPVNKTVVKGHNSLSWASIELRSLKVLLCSSVSVANVAGWISSALEEVQNSNQMNSDTTHTGRISLFDHQGANSSRKGAHQYPN